jgi:hypothetical protein
VFLKSLRYAGINILKDLPKKSTLHTRSSRNNSSISPSKPSVLTSSSHSTDHAILRHTRSKSRNSAMADSLHFSEICFLTSCSIDDTGFFNTAVGSYQVDPRNGCCETSALTWENIVGTSSTATRTTSGVWPKRA